MSLRKQAGATGGLVAIVLVLLLLGFLATYVLSKYTANVGDRADTVRSLDAAASSLEAFVALTGRLPCPADPTVDTGLAMPETPSANCTPALADKGTLPWKTIGMRREDSFDSWGRKVSYRVFTSNDNINGSLTQPGGASMVDCDTIEVEAKDPIPVVAGVGGLCQPTHDTTVEKFLVASVERGLRLKEFDAPEKKVAYVLISHGPSGAGAYTASGAQIMDPNPPSGDERDNTRATGPFVIKAWAREDAVGSANYFDDVLMYRTIADLVRRANLSARDWPDVASVKFDQPTLTAALGHDPATDIGQQTVNFNYVSATGFNSGGNQNLSFDNVGAPGIGGGGDGLSSTGGEGIRLDFQVEARQFAFTLDDFGYHGIESGTPVQLERVELKFWDRDPATGTAALVNTTIKTACKADGGIASFSVDPGVVFDRVEIRPMTTSDTTTASYFFLSEIRTCLAAVACKTTLSAPANECA